MKLIDTHAHLCDDQFDDDREAVVQRAKEKGIDIIVEIADSPSGWQKAEELSKKCMAKRLESYPAVYWTCGFHPHCAGDFSDSDFDALKKTVLSENCVAIGEIGLDYVKSSAPKEKQISLLKKTLEIAVELDKPVVIHCRQAQSDVLKMLKSFFGGTARENVCPGVVHCFSGDLNFAEACIEMGFCLGVDGPITYPSANELRKIIPKVPLDKIVLETDSPYLPPQDFRGKRNEPSYIVCVAEKMAELFQKSSEEIARITTTNAMRLFGLK